LDLEPHLTREERVLFPLVRRLAGGAAGPSANQGPGGALPCGGTVRNPIAVMLADHDQAGALLARLRTLTDDYAPPPDACASYRAYYRALAELDADTHLHVHKENNLLFPAVLALEAHPTRPPVSPTDG
jgi:regulator of cell morphogenesis and NO signaling